MTKPEIYCPKCVWHPKVDSLWQCFPGCGMVWNTFHTGGVCPTCNYKWEETQCLACLELSWHVDWYHFPEQTNQEESENIAIEADLLLSKG